MKKNPEEWTSGISKQIPAKVTKSQHVSFLSLPHSKFGMRGYL
jgi:hypothetical protein